MPKGASAAAQVAQAATPGDGPASVELPGLYYGPVAAGETLQDIAAKIRLDRRVPLTTISAAIAKLNRDLLGEDGAVPAGTLLQMPERYTNAERLAALEGIAGDAAPIARLKLATDAHLDATAPSAGGRRDSRSGLQWSTEFASLHDVAPAAPVAAQVSTQDEGAAPAVGVPPANAGNPLAAAVDSAAATPAGPEPADGSMPGSMPASTPASASPSTSAPAAAPTSAAAPRATAHGRRGFWRGPILLSALMLILMLILAVVWRLLRRRAQATARRGAPLLAAPMAVPAAPGSAGLGRVPPGPGVRPVPPPEAAAVTAPGGDAAQAETAPPLSPEDRVVLLKQAYSARGKTFRSLPP